MAEQIQDQISAFTDDELTPEECEFLVRRLERDPESRDKVLRYAAIGAALRGELLGPDPDVLRNRVRQILEGVSLAARTATDSPGWATRMIRPVLGTGIAAGVAALGLLALNNATQISPGGGAPVIVAQQATVGEPISQALSYVVPQDDGTALGVAEQIVQPQILLTNYLVRHGEYTIGIGRRSIHSNVVSGQDTWRVADQLSAEE
jgi:anti-sigma factor RsiW